MILIRLSLIWKAVIGMSKVKELIKEKCPEGVRYQSIESLVSYTRGKGMSKDDKGTGDNPIILYGELYTAYGNYIDDIVSFASDDAISASVKICRGDVLLPISSTTKEAQIGKASVLRCDSASLGSDAVAFTPNEEIIAEYLMYVLNSGLFELDKMKCVKGVTIRHLDAKKMMLIEIPVPPVEIQQEIVRILDRFVELENGLQTELELRKKQYDYYKDYLYNLEDVEFKKIGDFTRVFSASRVHKDEWTKSGIPFWRSSDVTSYYNGIENPRGKAYISEELYKKLSAKSGEIHKGDILITGGGSIGLPYIVPTSEPMYVKDADLLCIVKNECFISEYLFYYFHTTKFRAYLQSITHDATIAHYTISQILATPIPLPPIEKQQEIVNILSKFHNLCNDFKAGLPAEIEAHHKQYEYYRDKLLTFERKVV